MPDSPAALAGLRDGDLVLSLGEQPVKDVKDLSRMVARIEPGARVAVVVERGGARKSLALEVGAMPGEETAATTPVPASDDSGPRLGLYLAPLTSEARQAQGFGDDVHGVLVAGVEKGSPAEKAGIEPGSLITMVGQHGIASPSEATSRVREAIGTGSKGVLLRVERDGEARFVALKPAA
jgi:serine protease Do